jgi:D-arabinitol dehydrogenase (NADP+)
MMSWYEAVHPSPGKQTDQAHQIKVKACGVCGTDLHIHEGEFIAKVPSSYHIKH